MHDMPFPIRIGLDIDPTQSSWVAMREVVVRADLLGYDSLRTWDHLYGARNADIWHHRGGVKDLARKLDVLRRACDALSDGAEIELAFSPEIIIRDDPRDAVPVRRGHLAAHLQAIEREPALDQVQAGPPDAIAELRRPYLELGFRHLIGDLAAPYDMETVERLPSVRAMMGS